MTERCFGTTSDIAVQSIVHKNHTLRATVFCWRPLTDQLFQDHELLSITALKCNTPKSIIYCLQGCKRIHPHRSNEYIMVSNALGGVNGRSRAVMYRFDVDQYRLASLPEQLDAAQGAYNCCAWFLTKPIIQVVQIKILTTSLSRDRIPPFLIEDFFTYKT